MKILLAEDEKNLARAIVKIFEKNNYSIDAVSNGNDALCYLELGEYDAAVLDIMMPGMDGVSVLREARRRGCTTPVMFLTAKSEIEDKVTGLDSGADYYLTKPFDSRELLAAIRAITRTSSSHDSTLCIGNVRLDRASFILSGPDGEVRLANKEFQMLEMLMSNPTQIIPTERFMEKIWGCDSFAEINVIWVYVSYLRRKLEKIGASIEIKASRNAGYSLEEKE